MKLKQTSSKRSVSYDVFFGGCVAAFSLDKLSQNISWAEGRLAVREEIQNEIKRQAAFIGYHFVIWI